MATGALSRFRILDLTRVRAGPTCVRQFADFGAQVIKIESAGGDAGMGGARLGPDFQNLHRNKRCITLDLKSPDGLEILRKLVAQADVMVENFRPDVKDRLGIGYEAMKAINPRIVYASISGFGEDGPYRMRPGFDQIAQGMGGIMSVTGLPGHGPVRAGIPVADLTAGLFAAQGIMAALLEREVSGEGQWVQSSLLGSMIAMMDFQAARWLMDKDVPKQAGNDHPTSIPTGVFPTKDGHINIAASGDKMFARLCKELGFPDLVSEPHFKTGEARSANRGLLNERIATVTRTDTSASWVERLEAAEVPCGPIYAMDEVFADPQVKHLGMAQAVEHPELGRIEIVGQAIKLSRTPAKLETATAGLSEHTDEVLAELGYDAAAIAGLHERGAV
ncbi:CaiB/BaiF CoA-transferase family protein [Acidisphaera sp. L21]|uniref:CaiB/BaiF CoA transferase family protein n=1 Tax=Acidisphaera sp. L21 TaxID=1641851 RepID=UPI00131BED39|nr:CoA transferase [Acidisphaera sp. L21]